MAVSVFKYSYLSTLLGDDEMVALFDDHCDINSIVTFEIALAEAQALHGIIPKDAAKHIAKQLSVFSADMASLKLSTANDGVAIPELVKQIRGNVDEPYRRYVHYGATSQDAIDTSLMLRLTGGLKILCDRLEQLIGQFHALDVKFGGNPLMGITRMQAALPIRVADRVFSWIEPLKQHHHEITKLLEQGLPVQFGGAVGTLDAMMPLENAVRATLATKLGLSDRKQWHSQRAIIVDIASLMAKIAGTLAKFGQDIAIMAQMGGELTLVGGGASSAMPHKQNPVSAEVLISLGRFSAVQMSGLYQTMIHEQERSGSAWTLEWMIFPQVVCACGASTKIASKLINSVESMGVIQQS